jgi:hypothetical protein
VLYSPDTPESLRAAKVLVLGEAFAQRLAEWGEESSAARSLMAAVASVIEAPTSVAALRAALGAASARDQITALASLAAKDAPHPREIRTLAGLLSSWLELGSAMEKATAAAKAPASSRRKLTAS